MVRVMERAIAVFDYLDRCIARHGMWNCVNPNLTDEEHHIWNMEAAMLHNEKDRVGCWLNYNIRDGKRAKVRTPTANV